MAVTGMHGPTKGFGAVFSVDELNFQVDRARWPDSSGPTAPGRRHAAEHVGLAWGQVAVAGWLGRGGWGPGSGREQPLLDLAVEDGLAGGGGVDGLADLRGWRLWSGNRWRRPAGP